jgi:hypothetical protein
MAIKPKKKGAPKGNEFWRLVQDPTGRPKSYTPVELWKKAIAYFEWVEKNPLKEHKVFGTRYKTTVPKMRAMTEKAFCLYAGIDRGTWRNYKSGKVEYKDFFIITEAISDTIYQQKFEGAAADCFNCNIISRDLGLTDKKSVEIDYNNLNEETVDLIYQKIIEKANGK